MGTQPDVTASHAVWHFRWPAWCEGLREDYEKVFVEPWSPYFGAVLLAIATSVLMLSGVFWGVFAGLKLWGDYLNQFLGLGGLLGIADSLENPLLHRTSLMNITLIAGALAAALISRQFRINRPPPVEYLWGALGGVLMGVGATLAGGCTVGGFLTPLMFASPVGWTMWLGLLLGAYLGLRLLLWAMERVTWGTTPPTATAHPAARRLYPLFGLLLIVLMLAWAATWYGAAEQRLVNRAIIVLTGFALGFIVHRSRFCFAHAFREPFMTGEGEMTRAMILLLAVGIPLGSLLLQKGTVDAYVAIPAAFWLGSLVGGVIFGIGMVFAGGCATGALWRIGEGHLKLVVAAAFFGWTGSVFGALMKQWGVTVADIDIDFLDGIPEITQLGFQAYLPDLLGGWGWVYGLSAVVLTVWYLLVRYNESSERFTVF